MNIEKSLNDIVACTTEKVGESIDVQLFLYIELNLQNKPKVIFNTLINMKQISVIQKASKQALPEAPHAAVGRKIYEETPAFTLAWPTQAQKSQKQALGAILLRDKGEGTTGPTSSLHSRWLNWIAFQQFSIYLPNFLTSLLLQKTLLISKHTLYHQ